MVLPATTLLPYWDGDVVPYLSRIWLNPLRSGTQRLLRNPQAMHAAVLGGFPTQPVTDRVLWRLELGQPHRAELLVLSGMRPSWEHLVEQAGWPGAEDPQAVVRSYQPLLERLSVGQQYAFRVRANPVSSTRHPLAPSVAQKERLAAQQRPRGVRVAHRTARDQLVWFTDRIESWGFSLLLTSSGDFQLQLSGRDRISFTKSASDGERRRVTIQTAVFEGTLQVTEPTTARNTLLNGIGSGRAYGCGLVTLSPLYTA